MIKKHLFFRTLAFMVWSSCFWSCTKPCSQPAAQNNIHSYLSRVAEKMTDHALSEIKTKDDWERIREQRYEEFLEMTGIQKYLHEERTPLHINVVDVIQKEGFRIEKLIYESLPGGSISSPTLFLRHEAAIFGVHVVMKQSKQFIERKI